MRPDPIFIRPHIPIFTVVNPISIEIDNADGQVIDQIQATVSAISTSGGSESVTLGSTTSDEITFNLVSGMSPAGALATIGSLYQPVTHPTTPYRNESSYVAWTSYQYSHKQLVGTSVYSVIPTDGTAGTAGVNYDQTQYGYNAIGDQVWTKTPAGTITWNVLDARGLVASMWVGTDDVPTSDYNGDGSHNAADFAFWLAANPTATQGPSGTDMVEAATAAYNADGLATSTTQHADSSSAHDRTTAYGYDWRDRLLSTMVYDGTHYTYTYNTYDNLNEVLQTQGYQAATAWTVNPAGDTLLSQATTAYDGLGEVYHSSTYVEDTTQSPHVWTAQTTNYWYDADGNERKLEDPDSNSTEWSCDGLGRITIETDDQLATNQRNRYDKYDDAGELVQATDRDGRAITYAYDGLGRTLSETWYASVDVNGDPAGSATETISYTYNAAGLPTSASDQNRRPWPPRPTRIPTTRPAKC